MKRIFLLLAATAIALAVLAACRGKNDGEQGPAFLIPPGHPLEMMEEALSHFPRVEDNGQPHLAGTTFQWGLVSASAWPGILGANVIFGQAALDSSLAGLLGTGSSLIAMNERETFGEGGVAIAIPNVEAKTLVIEQQLDVQWHDGVPLTLADLYFTFHVLGHPDNPQVTRLFEGSNRFITGMMDYREGNAESISGLTLSNNNRTLTIQFDEFPPTILYFGVITAPIPEHIFKDIPVSEMMDSEAVRSNPIGWGPFKFEHLVPGEQMSAVRNENYVFGAPHIERIIVRRIARDMVADAMVAGEFDAISFSAADYEYHMEPTNWRYFGTPGISYNFVAFRLGNWCFETDRNLANPDRYMNRPGGLELRRAMAMAPDFLTFTQMRYNGLVFPAGAYLSPRHVPFMDLTVPMFAYDPEGANKILDDAGFTTRDSEGFRNWPDGERLEITWAYAEGDTAELYYQFYTQAWSDIGVRVTLWENSFHDMNHIWDSMDFDSDNDEVHIWNGGWQAGANPDPSGVWGPGADWNASRHTSPEWEALLERLNSPEAWDEEYLMQTFSEIQWYKYNNIFYFPTTWSITLTAVNNRVANWNTRVGVPPAEYGWHTIRLTAASPYRG